MRSRTRALLGAALIATTAYADTDATADAVAHPIDSEEKLRARLAEVLADEALGDAKVGALVAEVDSGRVLFSRNEGEPLSPASTIKLATAAAALSVLGPEHRFHTEVLGKREAGTPNILGDLVLRGYGDPGLVTESLYSLAQRLRAEGVRRVEGSLIVDDTYFEPPATEPDTRPDADAPYRAPPAALSLNHNTVSVLVRPAAAAGTPAEIQVLPDSWYIVRSGRISTVDRGPTRINLRAVAQEERTELILSGQIPLSGRPRWLRRRIVHPALFVGRTFLAVLFRHGIQVARSHVRIAAAAEDLPVLATHESEPLSALLRDMNKTSSNVMADQILMAMGAQELEPPGTFAKGLQVVGDRLHAMGIPREWFHLASGSGLDTESRLCAVALVRVLRATAQDFRYSADFEASLAVAGADGTLRRRYPDSPAARYVRAKTGTLTGVVTLAGYAGGPGRGMLAFAVLLDDLPGGVPTRRAARRKVDEFAAALTEYLRR